MTLLFEPSLSVETSFAIKPVPEQGGLDTALLGIQLWKCLASPGFADRFLLSIRPSRPSQPYTSGNHPLKSLSCWAIVDNETTDLSIPPHWPHVYSHLFSTYGAAQSRLTVTTVEPISLTEVVLTAFSTEAFNAACTQDSAFENWLFTDRAILRQGDIHTFGTELLPPSVIDVGFSSLYRFRMDMVEPVQQGYAQKNITRIVITLADETTRRMEVLHQSRSAHEDGSESDPDGIEIDEGFLASSVLPSTSGPLISFQEADQNGQAHDDSNESAALLEIGFRPLSLLEPISAQDECNLYLRTADLGRVGVLSGDWGIARSSGISCYRLVRIFANDNLAPVTGFVMGSPALLYNLCPTSSSEPLIFLYGSPFGHHQPSIPTASSIALARVASPLSIDRTYQPLFLHALKIHLDGPKRLVKRGDILAVGIDTDIFRSVQELDSRTENVAPEAAKSHQLDHPTSSRRTSQIIFFVITDVKHDAWSAIPSTLSISTGSTLGDLGCWVDASFTRVILAGVEHSRVPDMGVYIGADQGSPRALLATSEKLRVSYLLSSQSAFRQLLALSSATLLRHAVDYELHLSVLLKGKRGVGKFTVVTWVAQRLGMHLFEVNCYDLVEKDDVKTEGTLQARFDQAASCSPCFFVLRHIDALARSTQTLEIGQEPAVVNVLRECINFFTRTWRTTGYPVLIIGTTSDPARLPVGVLSCFKHEIAFNAPSGLERCEILNSLLADATLALDVSLSNLATQTAALVASDLADLVDRAKTNAFHRVFCATNGQGRCLSSAGISLIAADFDIALAKARASYSESIGSPKIPNVSWDDVGGLANIKFDILETIQLPLDHPELFSDGLKKRSGILLYGPPGTGKTLLAKAVATSCALNFFSIKGPELLNMYIGESEANVRRVFQQARDAKPCVIFFDELDSVAPKRGNHGDSGGVMDRIVSQLLGELDGMSTKGDGNDVFVIGATNRPDLLDPALLRPGRFDRMLYLGVSDSHEAQLNILGALTRKFHLHPGVDLSHIANRCPLNYTGADLYALCSDALLNAMSRKAEELDSKIEELNCRNLHSYQITSQYFLAEIAATDDLDVLVSQADFDIALQNLVPSVSQSELDHYASIQRQFSCKDNA